MDVGQAVVEAERLLLVIPAALVSRGQARVLASMPWLAEDDAADRAVRVSRVVTMPPSPVVIAFTGWKLKMAMSE